MKFLTTGSDFLKAKGDFKLVGRDDDLRRLSATLMRSKAASVMITGPGGVGVTALCMGLQASKNDPNAPFDIVAKRFHWLQTDKLFASGNSTEISEAFRDIAVILKRTPFSVLIVEDAKDLITNAQSSGTTSSVIGVMNDLVKSGDTQVILEVRDEDLDLVLRAHSDFRECYTILDLAEPIGDTLKAIVNASAVGLMKHHGIKIDPEAVLASIEMTNKYRTRDASLSRAQPERSMNLLDRALASYRLEAHKHIPLDVQQKIKKFYEAQREGEIAIIGLEEEIDEQKKAEANNMAATEQSAIEENRETKRVSAFQKLSRTANFESSAVQELRQKIKQWQEAVDANRVDFERETADANASLLLTPDMVLAEFSRLSGIPASKLNEDERVKLKNLTTMLESRVFGQEAVITKVANAIKTARIGRRNGSKPQAAFMFQGPSGVGKTELAKAIAWALLDDETALTRFDMSEYMEKHAVAKLIGAPPGYEGFEVGGILTNAMRTNPRRVLLFDEVEKADVHVFDVFLQILSDGRLTDSIGRTVSFSESIIIMTSNIGLSFFLDDSLTDEEKKNKASAELEARGFRPEILNRFAGRENIIPFHKLDLSSIKKIVSREIVDINSVYGNQGITLNVTDEILEQFCKDHYDPAIGARGLPGYIQANLEPIITNTILDNPDFKGVVNVNYDDEKQVFTTNTVSN